MVANGKMKKPLYIRIKNGRVFQSKPLNNSNTIIIDFNDKLQILGIEILDYQSLEIDGK